MYIVLRAYYGTRNAGVFVVQTRGFEDFGFVDDGSGSTMRLRQWRKPLFLGLELGLGLFLPQRTW